MNILEFATLEQAKAALSIIDQTMIVVAIQLGYSYDDGEGLVGKNLATEQDEPKKTKTKTYDTIVLSPDQTYYLRDPRDLWPLEDGPALIQLLDANNISYKAIEMPENWQPEEEI